MTKTRTTYHHGDLHAALIRASDEIITEGGFEAFSLRVAAKRAGVSPAAPAHHFGSAKGLLTEVAILSFNRLQQYIEARGTPGDVVSDVRGVSLGFIQFALDNPGHFRLMFRNDLTDKDNPRLREAFLRPGYRLGSAILTYQGKANFDLENFDDAADMLAGVSTLHGVAELILEGGAANIFAMKGDRDFARKYLGRFIDRLYPAKRMN